MKIEVSDGEIVDKYSILCLKLDLIQEKEKRNQIKQEKELLDKHAIVLIDECPLYYSLLSHVNQKIWDKTNEIKALHLSDDPEAFAVLAFDIFSLNDQRFRLKRIFNTRSYVKEQKSYAEKIIQIFIPNKNVLQDKRNELISMLLVYDHIKIQWTNGYDEKEILQWIPSSCVSFHPDLSPPVCSLETLSFPDTTMLSLIRHFTKEQA